MMQEIIAQTTELARNARIEVYLSGLGLLCFSGTNKRAEIGYLDLVDHPTQISICDSNGKYILEHKSIRGKVLEIKTRNGGIGSVFHASGDDRDFSKMLDLSEIYGDKAEFKDGFHFQSKIFIDEAVFYTEPHSLANITPLAIGNPSRNLPSMKVGQGLVAAIDQDVKILLDGEEIPLDPKETYIITIQSNCDDPPHSDFKHFFEILKNAGDIQYNLEYPDGESPWFTEFEQKELNLLGGVFNNLFSQEMKMRLDIDLRMVISSMKKLTNRFCVPKPCLFVTFVNRERDLP